MHNPSTRSLALLAIGALAATGCGWAFANALHALVHPLVTVPGYVLHLCHPRSRGRSKRQGRPLWNRYEAAFGDREATEALIREEGHGGIEG